MGISAQHSHGRQCVDKRTLAAVRLLCGYQHTRHVLMSRVARVRSARDLGSVIAEARQLQGLTQGDLAEATDIERYRSLIKRLGLRR